jgi:hypothetical protein
MEDQHKGRLGISFWRLMKKGIFLELCKKWRSLSEDQQTFLPPGISKGNRFPGEFEGISLGLMQKMGCSGCWRLPFPGDPLNGSR